MVHGPHILITRPLGQHEQFARACKALGFQVSHLPCLAINALLNPALHGKLVSDADSILFTSANAVEHAHAHLPLPWPDVAVRAIGPATANALKYKGQLLVSEPSAPYSSDAFLTQVNSNPPERLIIIKGQGGRTQISERLNELGWQVQSIDVYKRVLPEIYPSDIDEVFAKRAPDIITIGSNETLSNLISMADDYLSVLLRIPLLVNSDRCATLASSMGFQHASLVARPPGDQGQLSALKHWLKYAANNKTD